MEDSQYKIKNVKKVSIEDSKAYGMKTVDAENVNNFKAKNNTASANQGNNKSALKIKKIVSLSAVVSGLIILIIWSYISDYFE